MEFAVKALDPVANKYTQMLVKVQNSATCFISDLKRRDGVTRRKKRLGLVAVEQRLSMQIMTTLLKIMELKGPFLKKTNVFIEMCFKEDSTNTRAKLKGQPLQSLLSVMLF